jgi:hypothetical protein
MIELAIIFAASFAVTALAARAFQLGHIRKHLRKPIAGLPNELVSRWASSRIWSFTSQNAVVGSAVGLNTGQALYHLSQIDSAVLASIDKIYEPQSTNTYRQIIDHLNEKREASEAAWDGAVSKYKGEYGELLIAEHLRESGHVVDLAENKNQEGWDAIVDGHVVNFKAGLRPEVIDEHLRKFPDIPVITVVEHAETFAINPMVTTVDVSGQAILDTTEGTMRSALDFGNFAEGIPLVTMVASSIRNFAPVMKGRHNDWQTAAKYTAADTAGIGVGAAAGAKIGATIGVVGGPIGAAAGGVLGGLIGAVGGRWVAKGFKEQGLREAQKEIDPVIETYGELYVRGLEAKAAALDSRARQFVRSFSLWRWIRPSVGDVVRMDAKRAYKNWARNCRKQAELLVVEHTKEGEAGASYQDIGRSVLGSGPEEAVYSPALQECMKRLRRIVAKITSEQTKLGYA